MKPEEKKAMDASLRKRGILEPPAGKGSNYCEYLDSRGWCSVYDDRPIVCRAFGKVVSPMMTCTKPGFVSDKVQESPELRKYFMANDFVGNRREESEPKVPLGDRPTIEIVQMAIQMIHFVQKRVCSKALGERRVSEIEKLLNERGESLFKYLPPGAMQIVFGSDVKSTDRNSAL